MSCPNTISLRCCSDPSVVIKPCTPIIDGVPYQSFTPGNSYLDDAGICWEAVELLTPTNFSTSSTYTTQPNCATCILSQTGDCSLLPELSEIICYCIDITIEQIDIDNSILNVRASDFTVIVDIIDCVTQLPVSLTYNTAGNYKACGVLLDNPYYFNTDTKTYGISTATVSGSICSTEADCIAPPSQSATPTPTVTPTVTPTNSPTPTVTPTSTPIPSPSNTPTVTPTNSPTPTVTPSVTPTNTPTNTPTVTPTSSVTPTSTPTVTPTVTPTNTQTPTVTPTVTPSPCPCECIQIDSSLSFTATGNTDTNLNNKAFYVFIDCSGNTTTIIDNNVSFFSVCTQDGQLVEAYFYKNDAEYSSSIFPWEPIPDYTITYAETGPCCSQSDCGEPVLTLVPSPTPTPTPTVTPTNSPTPTVTPTSTPIPSPSNTPTVTPTNSPTPTVTPTNSPTPTVTPSVTPTNTPTNTPTVTPTVTPTSSVTPTSTPTNTPTPTPTPVDCFENYCLYNTGNSDWDDQFTSGGTYDGYTYWVGDTTGLFIYYDTTNSQWCLSSSLGGTCLLSGKSPCVSQCPDLCHEYFSAGVCPTPTPTPTQPCNVDFEALFDCEYTPTPTPTPTASVTPTVTQTPTPSDYCSVIGVDATINSYTPTPSPTPSITPSNTPSVIRPCTFVGDVTFNTIDEIIKCPYSKQFQDCYNGMMYYTTNEITNPGGETIEPFMVFEALVDGESRCVSYIGDNQDTIGINQIELRFGPFGYSNLGDCINCNQFASPTPTSTITPTPTPTPTVTPTPTPIGDAYYIYRRCDDTTIYVVQTSPGPVTIPNYSFNNLIDKKCWSFVSVSSGIPSLNPSYTVINYTGNYFTSIGSAVYESCSGCTNSLTTTTTSTTTETPTSCTINYTHTKSSICAKTVGNIMVNGIIKYGFSTSLLPGIYTGSFTVNIGDVITFNFGTISSTPSCELLNSTIDLYDNFGLISESAENGTPINTIYTNVTVTQEWCNDTLILVSNAV